VTGRHRQRRPYAARHQSPYPSKRNLGRLQFIAMGATLLWAWIVLCTVFVRALVG